MNEKANDWNSLNDLAQAERVSKFKSLELRNDSTPTAFRPSLRDLGSMFPYRFDPKRDPIDIILNENPVPIRDRMPGLEKNLASIIHKALVRNPKDRFPDAGKLLGSLSIS